MLQTHNVIIIDNKNAGNYSKMIDAFKPKGATKCFLTVSKFTAGIDLPDIYTHVTHNIVLQINGVQNSFVNDSYNNIIRRSNIVDTFFTRTFDIEAGTKYAMYDCQNNQESWLEMNMDDLNNFQLMFKSANNEANGVYPIQYSEVSDNTFQFSLHLKIRFE